MRYGILTLALLLVACGGSTGNVIEETTNAIGEQVEKLQDAMEEKDSIIATKDALVADAKVIIADLEQQLEDKTALVNQQKVILKEMDNERLEALAEAERCAELEEKNEKLQKMLDICQEDLS